MSVFSVESNFFYSISLLVTLKTTEKHLQLIKDKKMQKLLKSVFGSGSQTNFYYFSSQNLCSVFTVNSKTKLFDPTFAKLDGRPMKSLIDDNNKRILYYFATLRDRQVPKSKCGNWRKVWQTLRLQQCKSLKEVPDILGLIRPVRFVLQKR